MDSITIGKYQFFIDKDPSGKEWARYYFDGGSATFPDAQFIYYADNDVVVALIKRLLEIQNDKG